MSLGGWEWVLIGLIALLLFGGSRLSGIGRNTGRAVWEFKDATTGPDAVARADTATSPASPAPSAVGTQPGSPSQPTTPTQPGTPAPDGETGPDAPDRS